MKPHQEIPQLSSCYEGCTISLLSAFKPFKHLLFAQGAQPLKCYQPSKFECSEFPSKTK